MGITREQAMYVANLSRLALTEEELGRFTEQLSAILAYMEKLNQVDTSRVEPMIAVASGGNVLREDAEKPSLPADAAMKNAPASDDGFFKVPPVIE